MVITAPPPTKNPALLKYQQAATELMPLRLLLAPLANTLSTQLVAALLAHLDTHALLPPHSLRSVQLELTQQALKLLAPLVQMAATAI
jgi:hypothetical protein